MKQKVVRVGLVTLALLALTTTVAWAAPLAQEGDAVQDSLWVTLAPLLAIATFVERVLEVFWERYEQAGSWPNKAGVADAKVPSYVSQKKVRSQWIGTGFAAAAVCLTNFRFFRLLGLDVLFSSPNLLLFDLNVGGIFDDFTLGTLVDWLATAAIIGWGGTELTHSIIEGLVKGRNLWKEMREVEAGRQSILDAKFFNDYVVPELEKRGVSVATLRQAFDMLESVGVSPNELIAQMTLGQAGRLMAQLEADPAKAQAVQAVRVVLDGVPQEQLAEIPNVISMLSADQRQRFLGF
ncbi:MAG: hypothetical protein JXD18_05735 [Anaerolineae bacterium]|nr:hypothetical protein [Anaerolineae bacterium]